LLASSIFSVIFPKLITTSNGEIFLPNKAAWFIALAKVFAPAVQIPSWAGKMKVTPHLDGKKIYLDQELILIVS